MSNSGELGVMVLLSNPHQPPPDGRFATPCTARPVFGSPWPGGCIDIEMENMVL